MLNAMDSPDLVYPHRPIDNVLIVEDDALIALAIEFVAREMGIRNVEIVADPVEALRIATNGQLGAAILEIRTGSGSTDPVADRLAERGIPFLFCTGFGAHEVAERHRERPLLSKPYADAELRDWLMAVPSSDMPAGTR